VGVGAKPLPFPRAGAELAPLGSIPRAPAAGDSEGNRQQGLGCYPLVSLLIVGHAPRAVNENGGVGEPALGAKAPGSEGYSLAPCSGFPGCCRA
jgi:hypothetical protein